MPFTSLTAIICGYLNVTVSDWPSDGIGVQGGSDVQVAHCQVTTCRGHGFHPGTSLARSVWSHNIATGNHGDGLYFCWRVHDSVCSDSVFTGNSLSGIGGVAHGGDHHNIISNNVCSENAKGGIDASDGVEQVITGNLLRSNSRGEGGRLPRPATPQRPTVSRPRQPLRRRSGHANSDARHRRER